MSANRRCHHGGDGNIVPREERGAGRSCHTQPAPSAPTPALSLEADRSKRRPHFTAGAVDGAAGCASVDDSRVQEAPGRASTSTLGTPDAVDVDAAWDRLSAVVQRLVVREMKRRRAQAEMAPDDQSSRVEAADHLPASASPCCCRSTAAHPLSPGEGRGA
jgi:hypothetical protein